MSAHAVEYQARHNNGQFASMVRGEPELAMADASVEVPPMVRDQTRRLLGFVPAPSEDDRSADFRMADENADLVGALPGWDPGDYQLFTRAQRHQSGEGPGCVSDFEDAQTWRDPKLASEFQAGVREALEMMVDDVDARPPF